MTLIVFLPLLGFLIAGLFGRPIGARPSELVTTSLLGVCGLAGLVVFFAVRLRPIARRLIVPVATG